MELAVTIDVEEEGLFRNTYDSGVASTHNVATLAKLDPLFRKHGVHPTLFVTYAVATDPSHRRLLRDLADRWGGEIGAHLHHWNTPPFEILPFKQPVPSELMSEDLLAAKLQNLLDAVREMNPSPVSFRMGRFNLGPKMLRVLESSPVQVDSSVAPMRKEYGGPDHISAPADPYFPDRYDPSRPGASRILEVPITIVSLVRSIGLPIQGLSTKVPAADRVICLAAKYLLSLSGQPMSGGLRRLQAAALLNRLRRAKVFTLYFHSSELLPGGCPQHRTEEDVTRFLSKLDRFLSWARTDFGARSRVLSEIRGLYEQERSSAVQDRARRSHELGNHGGRHQSGEGSTAGANPTPGQMPRNLMRLHFFPTRTDPMVEEDREGRSASMMPLRMAVLLQDLEFGGTQRYAVNLLRLLNRDLFTPELWVCRRGYDLLPAARDAGVRTVYLSNSSWVGPQALSHLAWKLYHERPDILYTLTVVPNIWGRIIGSVLGVPVVVTGYRSLWPKQHDRWLWRLSRRIICNARASQRVLIERLKVDPTRVSYIPNGVDMSLIPEGFSRASRPTVLSVGRLVDEKDPLTLLESFRLTARAIPEASFVLVGDGYLKDDVQKFIQRHDLVSRVKLLPGTDRVYEHLSEAWVFALASRSESSPNVVIEAMGAGLPVVGTAVGGIPELIEHDRTGMLVEPGDSSRLSQALIRLLTHDDERKAMGIAARDAAVKNFSLESMVRETEKTLMEAASEASRNGRAEGQMWRSRSRGMP